MDKKKGSREFLDKFLEESSISQSNVASDEYKSNSWTKERNMSLEEQEARKRLKRSSK